MNEGFKARIRRRERRAGSILIVAGMLSLGSCASDKLVLPDGAHRVAVNTPQSLASYQDELAHEESTGIQKSLLERQVQALSAQVRTLKLSLAQQAAQATAPRAPDCGVPPQGSARASPVNDTPPSPVSNEGSNALFRISLRVGETHFAPQADLAGKILEAARSAQHVVVRGRTDSSVVDPLREKEALERALSARRYLIDHGVQSRKIRTWYRSAGDFVADNTTPEGRALNRRVEIETHGATQDQPSRAKATTVSGTRSGL